MVLVGLFVVGGAERARATPSVRVVVASFGEARASWRGPVTADEVADRMALVTGWAVADREHVRDAEKQLAFTGSDDPKNLVALGRRLGADLVIGGTLDGAGAALHAVLVAPQAGSVDKLDAKATKARPDEIAAAFCKQLVVLRHGNASALSLAAMEGIDGAGNDAAYEQYGLARERFYAGDFAGALKGIAAALALDGKMGRSHALAAYAHLKMKDYAGADAPARAALDEAPALREVRITFARVQDYNDHVDAAIEAYKNALGVAGEDAVAHTNLARLYQTKLHDHGTAAREYQAAVEDEPTLPMPAFNLALSQIELGRADDAVKALEKLRQSEPNNPTYALTLARALRRAGRPAAAIPLLQPQLASSAGSAAARAELALAQAEAGQLDDALKTLDGARSEDAQSARLRTARGRVLWQRNELAAAEKGLDEARAQVASSAPTANSAHDRHELSKTLAVVQLKQGKAAASAQTLRAVVDEDPLDAEALYDLGVALAAAGDASAVAQIEKAVKIAPYLVPAVIALGSMKLSAQDAAAAEKAYRGALSSGADDPRLHLGLGLALWRKGTLDEAVEELERAASATGDVQADASYALAEVLLAAGRRAPAREAAARYLTLEKRPDRAPAKARATSIAH
jgi:tetratricopeptide (TPR) repeat protein